MIINLRLPTSLALVWSLAGCSESLVAGTSSAQEAATATENGLSEINGLDTYNGLNSHNGLSVTNGLNSLNGLNSHNGLMSSFEGRITTSYLVKCALPAGKKIAKQDQNNVWYTYEGAIGVGPGWETGACDTACQEAVSACLMAHVNTAGVHIPLWLDSPVTQIGWGQNPSYPNQEGTYFGNIFMPSTNANGKPDAYFCNGPGWDRSVVPGRLGAYQANAPYSNPYGQDAQCAGNCVAASSPYQLDGYKSCKSYTRPVTVWRQNAPTFDASKTYKICSVNSGKCLDIAQGGKTNGLDAIQSTFSSASVSQKWTIAVTDGGYFKIINKHSGKSLDIWQGQQTDGARIVQWDYWTGANQNWAISPVGGGAFSIVGRHSSKALDVLDRSTASGARVQQWYYYGQPNQIWTVALNP